MPFFPSLLLAISLFLGAVAHMGTVLFELLFLRIELTKIYPPEMGWGGVGFLPPLSWFCDPVVWFESRLFR